MEEALGQVKEDIKTIQSMGLNNFLETVPPGQQRHVHGVYANKSIKSVELNLYCKLCNRNLPFRFSGRWPSEVPGNSFDLVFLNYMCKVCDQKSPKHYAVRISWEESNRSIVEMYKLGEYPHFGPPPTPTRLIRLIDSDKELFFKGIRAENQGMGIGAFGYYRRVVENQKNHIIDELIRVCKKLGSNEEVVKDLEAAKKEVQFKNAVDKIKAGIPQKLLILEQDPLKLLHWALSDGLHDEPDEECLKRAKEIRIVLTELAERIGQVFNDENETEAAMKSLMRSRSQKQSK